MNAGVIGGVAFAAAIVYLALAVYVLPQPYSLTISPPSPAPVIAGVSISDDAITLGSEFSLRVSAANMGDPADLQLVSVAFPNATRGDIVTVADYNFSQAPNFISPGDKIGSGYAGMQRVVVANYPAVEAQSMPWEPGETFSIDLLIRPETEGRFVVFLKAVGLPHSGDHAHYPDGGIVDQQGEYVLVYEVWVTND